MLEYITSYLFKAEVFIPVSYSNGRIVCTNAHCVGVTAISKQTLSVLCVCSTRLQSKVVSSPKRYHGNFLFEITFLITRSPRADYNITKFTMRTVFVCGFLIWR